LSGTTWVSWYQKKHSPTTLIVVINHPYLLSPNTHTKLVQHPHSSNTPNHCGSTFVIISLRHTTFHTIVVQYPSHYQ